jgi:hypothetical protein
MKINCVVACLNASGTPDFCPVRVKCQQEQYDNGDHYDAAREAASRLSYETGECIVFDENDGPRWLFKRFNWKTATRCEIDELDPKETKVG